jgi:hypothetical protein
MKSLLLLVCSAQLSSAQLSSARIARNAWRIALVVGTILNLINQGEKILDGNNIDGFHLILNYLVPYCVVSYSAAKNEMTGMKDAS